MRIFNGTNSTMNLPLTGSQRITVHPKSPSGDFLGNNEFLTMISYSYTDKEVAIIVSGPYEMNMCANIPVIMNYVVQSIDEAIERFSVPTKKEEKDLVPETPKEEEIPAEAPVETEKIETVVDEVPEEVTEEETVEEVTPKKKGKKK